MVVPERTDRAVGRAAQQRLAWVARLSKAATMTVLRYAAGEAIQHTQPGDFILTHRKAIPSTMIAFGQQIRFRGPRAKYAHWSHAALVVGDEGELIEMLGPGAQRTNISRYTNVEYHYVNVNPTPDSRMWEQIFAVDLANQHAGYGWLQILSLGLQLLTGMRVALTTDGRYVCSGMVATALERTGAVFPRSAGCMLPADLAAYYDVRP